MSKGPPATTSPDLPKKARMSSCRLFRHRSGGPPM